MKDRSPMMRSTPVLCLAENLWFFKYVRKNYKALAENESFVGAWSAIREAIFRLSRLFLVRFDLGVLAAEALDAASGVQ
jgi:hypothetical protein